jgi:hypothetical protein
MFGIRPNAITLLMVNVPNLMQGLGGFLDSFLIRGIKITEKKLEQPVNSTAILPAQSTR